MADQRPGGPPATPAIGAVPLPPGYVLVEKLGAGGFATVWLAEQGRLGRRVAVKLLGETLEDSERERRFIAECRAIGRLSGHPAVVTVHDAGTTDAGHPYLVMEHLPGGSLHDRMHREGALPWPDVLDIGVTVADALAAAHDAGILHRDIKPANVLLDANGSPKLGDFGIARLSEGTNTVTGTLVGTIPFTPPEVLSGHRPGPTADVWALGATLHTLLTAKSTFGGHRDEPPAATIARVLRSEPPALGPEVPAALRGLIDEMLRPEPRDRPESATEVVARLQAIQAERGLPVTPARATRSAPPAAPLGIDDATVVGAVVATTPPPPPPGPASPPPPPGPAPTDDVPWGEPTPPPFERPARAKADPADDPDAPTMAGPAAGASAAPAPRTGDEIGRGTDRSDHGYGEGDDPTGATVVGPAVAPVGPAIGPPPVAGAPGTPIDAGTPSVAGSADTVAGPPAAPGAAPGAPPGVEAATSVLPAADPALAPPRPGPRDDGVPPPPPPPPGGSRASSPSERRAKAPLLVGIAALVALVLVAGVVLALVSGGGDGDGEGSTTTAADTTGGPDDGPPATTVDTPLGAPLGVPSGLGQEPAAAWTVDAPCSATGACSIVADDGDVVAVRAPGDGTATVESLAADSGDVQWTLPIVGLSGRPGLARLGGLVVVSSTSGDTRTYRGIDDGDLRWEIEIPQAEGPVFPNTQLSEDFGVLLLGNVGAYLVVDLADGDTERGEGRVLATDRANVYVADGDRVVARSLRTGDDQWEAEGVVSAAPPAGVFPAWRYGTVTGGAFVTATADQVVGINPESGGPLWDAVPLSADGLDLGRPIAVANVGDVVVVAAERGDLGVRAGTGEVVWRHQRDRLVYDPELDSDAIAAAQGTPVWVGAGDHLLVGWAGAGLQLIDVTDGDLLGSVDLEPTGGRSSVAIGLDAIALIQEGGVIAAYGYETLTGPLWTTEAHPEAMSLAAVDGGLVVVDPTGLHALRHP